MSVMKLTFDIEEADRLRRNIGQVSQDTNRLYMQFKGQAGNWNGIPLGSSLQQAQVLLNELTVEAERLEDLIRTAVKGVQNVQEENKQRMNQLMQQFSMLGVLFGRLDGSAASGRMGIPALAQAAVMKLITSVSILSGRDELSHDPAVQKLQGVMKAAAFGSVDWFAAQIKLTEIYEARNQIAKAQTAYGVYQAFGNRTQMEAVHQSAEAARQKLESLGVNKLQYEPGKDLSGYFKQAAVQACDYDPSITAGSVPLLQDEAYQLLLRMAMEPGIQGEWAKSQLPSKRLEVQLAQTAKILAAKIEAEQRLAGPPVNLPDGTPITAKNKENEITLAYFQDKVYNPDAQLTPMYTAYLGWLEDTYGMTEWRKKVVQADGVAMAFTEALLKETVMGVVDTAKFAFRLAVDPEKTTQEVLDQANNLINHPEVLVEAAKTVYHNFEEGTPEERAAMLGSVASILVPGLSVTKSGKVGQVLDGVQGLTDKAVEGVKDLGKVLKNSEKFPGLNPFVTTPEGFTFNFNAGKIPETNPLPKTSVQEHYLSEMDGLGDGKAGKIEGTGKIDNTPPAFRQTEFASSYEARFSQTPAPENPKVGFEGTRGESKCTLKPPPDPDLQIVLDEAGIDGIQYKNAVPDFSPVAKAQVEIEYMLGGKGTYGGKARRENFIQSDSKLAEQLNNSPELARQFGMESGKISARDIKIYREKNNLTWHELNDVKTMQLVPTNMNSTFGHLGGVGEINAGAFEPGGFAK